MFPPNNIFLRILLAIIWYIFLPITILKNILDAIEIPVRNCHTTKDIRNLLKSILEESLTTIERNGFQKTPFINGKYRRLTQYGLSYEFYKISGLYMLYVRYSIANGCSWIECRYDVYRITDMPDTLEELKRHYGFFGNHFIGSTLSMTDGGMSRLYKLSYTTPFEKLRKMEQSRLKRKIIDDMQNIDETFSHLINSGDKKAKWYRLLVCNRYGVIAPIPGQESTAEYQRRLEILTPDNPEYEELVKRYGSYFNIIR